MRRFQRPVWDAGRLPWFAFLGFLQFLAMGLRRIKGLFAASSGGVRL